MPLYNYNLFYNKVLNKNFRYKRLQMIYIYSKLQIRQEKGTLDWFW